VPAIEPDPTVPTQTINDSSNSARSTPSQRYGSRFMASLGSADVRDQPDGWRD
jgi:hypothetical protein